MKQLLHTIVVYLQSVVPYIGTWIETEIKNGKKDYPKVVPYIGTWIETDWLPSPGGIAKVVPYIGTWIETKTSPKRDSRHLRRTLYRYVD